MPDIPNQVSRQNMGTRIEAQLEHVAARSRLPVKGWTVGDMIDRYIADIKPVKQ